MGFKRINIVTFGYEVDIRREELRGFVEALDRIESRRYHDRVPDTQEDYDYILRRVRVERNGRLQLDVEEVDRRSSGSRRWTENV